MDWNSKFSAATTSVIAKSRDIAINMGDDYISTIHFFIADCELQMPDSIYHFAFRTNEEYNEFKKSQRVINEKDLVLTDDTVSLTMEAERVIIDADKERSIRKHPFINPAHLFLAAVKNDESLLYRCFSHDKTVADKLVDYYKANGQLEEWISEMKAVTEKNTKARHSWFTRVFKKNKE